MADIEPTWMKAAEDCFSVQSVYKSRRVRDRSVIAHHGERNRPMEPNEDVESWEKAE